MKTTIYDPNEPVVFRQYWAEALAALDQAVLEAAGIPAKITRQPFAEITGPAVSLVIRRGDIESAREELESIVPDTSDETNED